MYQTDISFRNIFSFGKCLGSPGFSCRVRLKEWIGCKCKSEKQTSHAHNLLFCPLEQIDFIRLCSTENGSKEVRTSECVLAQVIFTSYISFTYNQISFNVGISALKFKFYTVSVDKILGVKIAQTWVSIVSYLKKLIKILKKKILGAVQNLPARQHSQSTLIFIYFLSAMYLQSHF